MTKPKTVDHFDLALPVSDENRVVIASWLSAFAEGYDYAVLTPRLKSEALLINSYDFVELLAYCNKTELSEMEWKRFEKSAEHQLELLLQKTLNADIRYHYQWCLTAIKNLEVGRRILS